MHTTDESILDLAIVGDGAAAALVAINALQAATGSTRLALIGPGTPGLGIAYATTDPGHRLNVPAAKMSAFADKPGDFVDFLRAAGLADDAPGDALAYRYVPRAWYGAYLQQRLQQALQGSAAQFVQVAQRVVGISAGPGPRRLQLADGRQLQARQVVLALGNALRALPLDGAGQLPPTRLVEAWDVPALQGIERDAAVLVVGTGLSMADAVVSLRSGGHRGPIHVVSRHGLLPLAHAGGAPYVLDGEALLALPLRQRLRVLRRHAAQAQAAGQPWQVVMEAIRPLGARLWTSLSLADQARFLRHLVRYWDVHRHRIAADVAAALADARADGQLQLHTGGVQALQARSTGIEVRLGKAGGTLAVDVVINATGLQVRTAAMTGPLLRQLLASGLAAPGPHGLGLQVAVDGQGRAALCTADGRPQPDLLLVGSLRMGNEWETIAIPELRLQAARAAVSPGA